MHWEIPDLRNFFFLFIGAAYLLVWIQVILFHWRGAFRSRLMWGPVVLSPVLSAAGVLYAFLQGGPMDLLLVIVYALGALEGLAGTYYHFRGVRSYIGGWTLRNFMVGPPVILTFIFMVLSIAALLVYFFGTAGGG